MKKKQKVVKIKVSEAQWCGNYIKIKWLLFDHLSLEVLVNSVCRSDCCGTEGDKLKEADDDDNEHIKRVRQTEQCKKDGHGSHKKILKN